MRRAAMAPDIGRVVGPDHRLDVRPGEGVAPDQPFEIADRSQHDVDDVLADDRLDRLEELFAGAQPGRGSVLLSRRPDGVQAGAHIGIFRVRDDEVRAPVIARTDPRELFIEPEHGEPPPGHRSRL